MTKDLALHYSAAESLSEAGPLARLIENWQARRAAASLLDLEDHVLSDAGLVRADIVWAAKLPLSQNATLAMEERLRRRVSRAGANARLN
jgi:uncharacterized protein YjiS (DUF1127 family)